MKLTEMDKSELRWMAAQHGLVWGGVYEQGGDADLIRLECAGLIERVAKPYQVGRVTFAGGFRITPAGRQALATSKGGR